MSVKLRFVNRSRNTQTPDILIFMKNTMPGRNDPIVAWKVIRHCGPDHYHPFVFSHEAEISVEDSFGNHSPRYAAHAGATFLVVPHLRWRRLICRQKVVGKTEIELRNELPLGAVNGNVYIGQRLALTMPNIIPGQKAAFRIAPTLWIGSASGVQEGTIVSSQLVASITTEISLIGIKSAEIVMYDKEIGKLTTGFCFRLENVF